MNKKQLIVIWVIWALLLNGCAGNIKNIRSTYSFPSSSRKGLVIAKIRYKNCDKSLNSSIIKIDNEISKKQYYAEYYFINDKPDGKRDIERNLSLELPIGSYILKEIHVNEELPSLPPFLIQWNLFKLSPLEIRFPVKAGSVTYIGTIELTRSLPKYYLNIKDEKEETSKELESKYPNLAREIREMEVDIANKYVKNSLENE